MEPIKSEENGILDPKKEAASVPGSNNGMLAAMLLDKKPDQETHVVNGHADFKKMNGGTAEAGKGKA